MIEKINWELFKYLGMLRIGGWGRHLGVGMRERTTEGTDPIPMVAAREDATEGEDDDQEKDSAQREPKGRSRCVHVGWQRKILVLHHNNAQTMLFLHSCVWGTQQRKFEMKKSEVNVSSTSSFCTLEADKGGIYKEQARNGWGYV